MKLTGIHHLTAIASDPARNVAFYTRDLGMRMVKKTINFDDPETYHLYYGDESGAPGTLLTFFPFPGVRAGRAGSGQVVAFAFRVREGSLGFWKERLEKLGHGHEEESGRFGEKMLSFRDPDGFRIELVESEPLPGITAAERAGVPPEHALAGFHGVVLRLDDPVLSAEFLIGLLGADEVGREAETHRLRLGDEGEGAVLDLMAAGPDGQGVGGAGTVHHIAWRTPDDEHQEQAHQQIREAGTAVSPVTERNYFRSIYFREPGGILYEIATDPPGFTVDEPMESLGSRLMLPPWMEPHREDIEARLPGIAGR